MLLLGFPCTSESVLQAGYLPLCCQQQKHTTMLERSLLKTEVTVH